jgi:hypothetical protein
LLHFLYKYEYKILKPAETTIRKGIKKNVCKCKMIHAETIPGMVGGGAKREW